MTTVEVRTHYERMARWLPIYSASSTKVEFGPGLVDFRFTERVVVYQDNAFNGMIAEMVGDTCKPRSIADFGSFNDRSIGLFSGSFVGTNFRITKSSGGLFTSQAVEVWAFDQAGHEVAHAKKKILFLEDFNFGEIIRCRYNGGSASSLEVTYDPTFEDLARTVGSVISAQLSASSSIS